jgi:hypothetical protein
MDHLQSSSSRSHPWSPNSFLVSSSSPPSTNIIGSNSAALNPTWNSSAAFGTMVRDALRWGNESLKIMSLQLGQSGSTSTDSSRHGNLLDTSYEMRSNGGGGGGGSGSSGADDIENFVTQSSSIISTWLNGSSSLLLMNQTENLLMSPGGSENESFAEPTFPSYVRTTSTLLCGIILFIGIVGNILVPIVVWRNKELRSSTNIFLVNLSLADLLILLVCMPPVLIELHSKPEVWVLGATMCKFLS